MSTPDQPGNGKLTRRQLREQRRTGVIPVVGADGAPAVSPTDESTSESPEEAGAAEAESEVDTPAAPEEPETESTDEPAPAEEPAPADEPVDSGSRPLTRREAREHERLRTNSVTVTSSSHELVEDSSVSADSSTIDVEATDLDTSEVATGRQVDAAAGDTDDDSAEETAGTPDADAEDVGEARGEVVVDDTLSPWSAAADRQGTAADRRDEGPAADADDTDGGDSESRPTVGAAFGVGVLKAKEPAKLAPSFDELITKPADSGGSVSTPNALILPQLPGHGALGGPVSATGEVIITSAHSLDGFGSQGHAKGAADGKDVDSVLLDGEIPLASSPTPIAASSAVSTSKSPGEVIRPPAPEKGGRMMFALAITAGVLGVALIGVLVVAWLSGAFS